MGCLISSLSFSVSQGIFDCISLYIATVRFHASPGHLFTIVCINMCLWKCLIIQWDDQSHGHIPCKHQSVCFRGGIRYMINKHRERYVDDAWVIYILVNNSGMKVRMGEWTKRKEVRQKPWDEKVSRGPTPWSQHEIASTPALESTPDTCTASLFEGKKKRATNALLKVTRLFQNYKSAFQDEHPTNDHPTNSAPLRFLEKIS